MYGFVLICDLMSCSDYLIVDLWILREDRMEVIDVRVSVRVEEIASESGSHVLCTETPKDAS